MALFKELNYVLAHKIFRYSEGLVVVDSSEEYRTVLRYGSFHGIISI